MEYKELKGVCKNAISNGLCFRMQLTLKIHTLQDKKIAI